MTKKLIAIIWLYTTATFAFGPTVECRFAALKGSGRVALDEIIAFTIDPEMGISGQFDPYGIEISVFLNDLTIGIHLAQDSEDDDHVKSEKPINGIQVPVRNIVNLPLGGSVFGINTVYHSSMDGFVSMRYECKKVL
jgi:hypothetical protein